MNMLGAVISKLTGVGGSPRRLHKVTTTPSSPRKNRKVIDRYLRRMGKNANQDLSLDSRGVCYIPFRKFLVIVDVPDDDGGQCSIYTKVFDMRRVQNKARINTILNELNSLQLPTGGATLSLDEDEVYLFHSAPIEGLKFKDMVETVEAFLRMAVDINANLSLR